MKISTRLTIIKWWSGLDATQKLNTWQAAIIFVLFNGIVGMAICLIFALLSGSILYITTRFVAGMGPQKIKTLIGDMVITYASVGGLIGVMLYWYFEQWS